LKAAWGVENMRPKHHFLWHNASRIAEGALRLDCFVHERKHQTAKKAIATNFVSQAMRRICATHGRNSFGAT
jgi:hypothetical protein